MNAFNDFLNGCISDCVNGSSEPAPKQEKKPTRAQRIRSYMEDSDMTRAEAVAMVDFEDGK